MDEQIPTFPPPAEFAAQAVAGADLYEEAAEDRLAYWARRAREILHWEQDFTDVLDWSDAPFAKWFVGGELNAQLKDWNCGGYGPDGEELTTRWALMYPDAYEVGVPNQGVMILYEVLNERPDALAERSYAVWPDMEALLREHGLPQFTVDGHRPIGDFDVFGLSFSTELGYTNMLTALDLAGIPLHAADRGDEHPLVDARGFEMQRAAAHPTQLTDEVRDALVERLPRP